MGGQLESPGDSRPGEPRQPLWGGHMGSCTHHGNGLERFLLGPSGTGPSTPPVLPACVAPSYPPQHTVTRTHVHHTPPNIHTHAHAPPMHTVPTTHSPTPRSERKPNSSQHTPVTRHCMKGDLQRKRSPSRRAISLLGRGTDDTLRSRLVPAEGTVCAAAHTVLPRCSGRVVQTLMLRAIPNDVCPGNWGMRGQAR